MEEVVVQVGVVGCEGQATTVERFI